MGKPHGCRPCVLIDSKRSITPSLGDPGNFVSGDHIGRINQNWLQTGGRDRKRLGTAKNEKGSETVEAASFRYAARRDDISAHPNMTPDAYSTR